MISTSFARSLLQFVVRCYHKFNKCINNLKHCSLTPCRSSCFFAGLASSQQISSSVAGDDELRDARGLILQVLVCFPCSGVEGTRTVERWECSNASFTEEIEVI